MLVILAASEVWFAGREDRSERRQRRSSGWLGALAVVTVIGVVILWSFYGFRYAARPAGMRLDPTLDEYVQPLNRVASTGVLLLARLHILPESWLYGLADVQSMASWWPTYFFGKVYAHGVWFYFPVLFTIKSTLGFLALLALALWAIVFGEGAASAGDLVYGCASGVLYADRGAVAFEYGGSTYFAGMGFLLRAGRPRGVGL